ncbi:MAG TPA: hypothetical protein VFC84_15635 [Desulfosporosinus sp.]|nr:hypothetical protein [Desulfosporosinus sp.]
MKIAKLCLGTTYPSFWVWHVFKESLSRKYGFGAYENLMRITDNILTSIPLLVILIVAWKYDLVGAIGFCFEGVCFLTYFEWGDFPIGDVPIFIGILFDLSWVKKRKKIR